MNTLKDLLNNNKLVKIGEIILIFVVAFGFIKIFSPFAGDNIVSNQIVIWFANILMLLYVWLGIKLRNQKLSDFGITFNKITIKKGIQVFLISVLVFIAAMVAFVLGSIVMANITGIP